VTPALLERAPHLLCVSTYGAGYDTVDVDACTRAGVCVVNQAGSNANAVAEHTLGLLLGLSKRIAECDRRLRRGERFARQAVIGEDIDGRTIGLVGVGHIGRRVAALARAFGMAVIASDPLLPDAEIERRGATPATLDALLHEADVVSVHCPLDAATRGLFGRAAFAAMKRGALFLSTARGGIHDEQALFDALASGRLGGAGLDVWSIEPPPADHPLLSLDNVLATYHIAGVTHGARRGMARMAAGQILGVATGRQPHNLVNPSVIPALAARYERVLGRRLGWESGSTE
jgi:D-3-phosphoglycerate dehydrogenase